MSLTRLISDMIIGFKLQDVLPYPLNVRASHFNNISLHHVINQILALPCKTCLKSLVMKEVFFKKHIREKNTLCQGNKDVYGFVQIISHGKSSAFDISTCKIWYAITLLVKRDYTSTLGLVNHVLGSIPPYALYMSNIEDHEYTTERLYIDYFIKSEYTTMKRARKAWLFDLVVQKEHIKSMPLAIQIEVYFSEVNLYITTISPLICLYYLMFVCYHELHQYDNRNCALRQLVDVANNDTQCGTFWHNCYNIAGHCLLVAGEIDQARHMFLQSYQHTLDRPYDKFNSALWYLQNFC